jgi:hypothetical protein
MALRCVTPGLGFFGNMPLGMLLSPNGTLLRTNKKKKKNDLGERSYSATRSDPRNPFNPHNPDETSVSMASPSGSFLGFPPLWARRHGALEEGDLALVIGVVLQNSTNHGSNRQAGAE